MLHHEETLFPFWTTHEFLRAFEGPNVSMGRREKIHDLKTAVCYGALPGSQIPKMPEVIRTTC